MKEFNCDLHFHGPQSSGVSKFMELPVIAKQSELKGLNVVSTSDILNEKWFNHVKKNLIEEENNVFKVRDSNTNLIIGTEINCNKRVHHLIYLPSMESAIDLKNSMKGKAIFDSWGCGRPTIRLTAKEIAEKVRDAGGLIGPAHAFTPYYSIYAHFNSLKELYESEEKFVYFMELGLSADTNLADLISVNHKYSFLTNSDSHCVHPESFIYKYNGEPIKIKDFDEKQIIQSFDFKKEKVINSIARKMKIESPKELIEIKCVSGHIKVTPEHRFFVLKKGKIIEQFASNLKKGDYIAIVSKLNFVKTKTTPPKINLIKYFKLNEKGLKKIKEKRKEKNLTQIQLEKKLGLKKTYYWGLETGKYKINEKTMKKIFKILKINQKEFTKNFCEIEPKTKIPKKFNEKISEMIGYVLGDGCFEKGRKGNQLGLTNKNKELLEYYSESFFSEFNEKRKVSEKDKTKNSYRLRLSSKILEFFNQISEKLLCKSNQRNVPSIIFNFNEKNTAAFIRGFFDAEGCVGNHYVDVCSSNLQLLKGIQNLLLKFEINSSIYENLFEKTKKKYRHRLYIFSQKNLKKYYKKINFNHNKKRKKLSEYLNKLKHKPKKSFIKKKSKTIFGKIQKIQKIKSDVPFVFDLSVNGYENYLVEGIITHNSPWPSRIGREFTRIKMIKPNFINLKKALKEKEEKLISLNVGLNPKQGKYHLTACQSCYANYSLKQAYQLNFKCIKCRKEIKKGVKDRVNELKDLKENIHPEFRPEYMYSIPLAEIIQNAFNVKNVNSVKVQSNWQELIDEFNNEINVLVDEPIENIFKKNSLIAEYINAFRKGLIVYEAGGGGNYGKPFICKTKKELILKQKELNEKNKSLEQKILIEY